MTTLPTWTNRNTSLTPACPCLWIPWRDEWPEEIVSRHPEIERSLGKKPRSIKIREFIHRR
jgi:hypothetical protein